MSAPVVVFAVGNPSRGDDAIGPVICGRLAKWLENQGLADRVEVIEDFQLQIEHVMDLQGRRLALFIDAGANTLAPYTFQRIVPAANITHTTHALAPEAVLQVFRQIEGKEPPPSFVLCVCGDRFDLGEGLTPAAQLRVDQTMVLLRQLIGQPDLSSWLELVTKERLPAL